MFACVEIGHMMQGCICANAVVNISVCYYVYVCVCDCVLYE